LATISHAINNTTIPAEFLTSGGVGEGTYILQDFNKRILNESNRAREMENEVIMQLTGLRSDLQQKIKEIKNLSGDFKNSVDQEIEGSRKAVRQLQEALGLVDTDPAATAGKGDPFIVKLGVDRQIERQIEEENYLHRVWMKSEMRVAEADVSRHISTSSLRAVSWSLSLLVKSRKPIQHMQVSSSVKPMSPWRRRIGCVKDHSQWQKITNGMFSSPAMIKWSTQAFPSDPLIILLIQERTIQRQPKFEAVCLNGRASTSRITLQDGKSYFPFITYWSHNKWQVHSFTNPPSRVQICRSDILAGSDHVVISPGAEAWLSLGAWVIIT